MPFVPSGQGIATRGRLIGGLGQTLLGRLYGLGNPAVPEGGPPFAAVVRMVAGPVSSIRVQVQPASTVRMVIPPESDVRIV